MPGVPATPSAPRGRAAQTLKRRKGRVPKPAERLPGKPESIEEMLAKHTSVGYKANLPVQAFVSDSFDLPLYQFYWDLEAMRRHDVCINALNAYKAGITGAQFKVEANPGKEKIAEFALQQMEQFWRNDLGHVQTGYDYGWLPAEILYEIKDGLLHYRGMFPFHPREAQILLKRGRFAGIRVTTSTAQGEQINLWSGMSGAPPKGFWYAHEAEFGRWYGRSQLYSAWRPWRRLAARDGGEEICDAAMYRFGTAGPVIRFPGNESYAVEDGHPHTSERYLSRQAAIQMGENLKAGGTVAMTSQPAEGGSGYAWDVVWPDHAFNPSPLIDYNDYLEKLIYKGIGIPPELLEASDVGSGWSGRKIPRDMYISRQQRVADGIAHAFFNQVILPVIKWNWGPDAWATVEVKSLLETFNEQEDPQQGQQPGGMPPPDAGPLGDALGGGGEEGGEAGGGESLGDLIDTLATAPARLPGSKYRYATTQFNLGEATINTLSDMAGDIRYEDRVAMEDTSTPHITVCYGLHTADPAKVQRAVEGFGAVKVTYGKTKVFPGKADDPDHEHDVVYVEVRSPDLEKLRRAIRNAIPNTQTFDEYKPHVTVAYVPRGQGDKYAGWVALDGHTEYFDRLAVSDVDGTMAEVSTETPDGMTAELSTLAPRVKRLWWMGGRYVKLEKGKPGPDGGRVTSGRVWWDSENKRRVYADADPHKPANQRRSEAAKANLTEIAGLIKGLRKDPGSVDGKQVERLKSMLHRLPARQTDALRKALKLGRAGRYKSDKIAQVVDKINEMRENPDVVSDEQVDAVKVLVGSLSAKEQKQVRDQVAPQSPTAKTELSQDESQAIADKAVGAKTPEGAADAIEKGIAETAGDDPRKAVELGVKVGKEVVKRNVGQLREVFGQAKPEQVKQAAETLAKQAPASQRGFWKQAFTKLGQAASYTFRTGSDAESGKRLGAFWRAAGSIAKGIQKYGPKALGGLYKMARWLADTRPGSFVLGLAGHLVAMAVWMGSPVVVGGAIAAGVLAATNPAGVGVMAAPAAMKLLAGLIGAGLGGASWKFAFKRIGKRVATRLHSSRRLAYALEGRPLNMPTHRRKRQTY